MLCHGLTTGAGEHGAFPVLRDRALRAGLAVVRFDFRAHGQSGGDNEHFRIAGLREDVDAVMALLDSELGTAIPTIPLGVSFGGAPAIHAAVTRKSAAGLVLWYAVVDYERNFAADSSVPATRQFRAAADPERDPPWAEMPVIGTDYHFPKGLLEETRTDPTLDQLRGLDMPVLGFYGSRDAFIDVAPLRRLNAEKPNIDLRMAWGAGHGFLLWRPWVTSRTVAWAARVAAAQSSAGLRTAR